MADKHAVRPRLGSSWSTTICAAAAVVMAVGAIAAYGRAAIFDTGSFTDRAVAILHKDAPATQLAQARAALVISLKTRL
mgnify:CR=1 FL=1